MRVSRVVAVMSSSANSVQRYMYRRGLFHLLCHHQTDQSRVFRHDLAGAMVDAHTEPAALRGVVFHDEMPGMHHYCSKSALGVIQTSFSFSPTRTFTLFLVSWRFRRKVVPRIPSEKEIVHKKSRVLGNAAAELEYKNTGAAIKSLLGSRVFSSAWGCVRAQGTSKQPTAMTERKPILGCAHFFHAAPQHKVAARPWKCSKCRDGLCVLPEQRGARMTRKTMNS